MSWVALHGGIKELGFGDGMDLLSPCAGLRLVLFEIGHYVLGCLGLAVGQFTSRLCLREISYTQTLTYFSRYLGFGFLIYIFRLYGPSDILSGIPVVVVFLDMVMSQPTPMPRI